MSQQPVYIVDIIGSAVAATSTKILAQLQVANHTITGVHYLFGHAVEIKARLQELSEGTTSKFDKYPIIALFQDFVEVIKPNNIIKCKLQLIIGYHSENYKHYEDRYSEVFKPILYPVYYEFLKQLAYTKGVVEVVNETISHEKIDRPHWGNPAQYGNIGYIFTDVLDAIEIRSLDITIDTLAFGCNK
jgi:hypothetical protein